MLRFSFVCVYEMCTALIVLLATINAILFSFLLVLGVDVGSAQQVQGFVGCCVVYKEGVKLHYIHRLTKILCEK